MPQDATCPKCGHTFPVTEARQAFTAACPRCETELTLEFKKPTTPPEAGQPPYDLVAKPGALPGSSAPPPAAPKKARRDDEDAPKKKGGSAAIVLLSGGLGLLFVLGGLGVTGWFLFTQIDTETVSNRSNTSSGNKGGNTNNSNNKDKGGNNKGGNNSGGNNNKGGNNNNPPPPPPPKKDPTFDLCPVAGPVPMITAPDLPQPVNNVDLGGRVGQIAVGGGGRYIIMHFPDKGQLGVFDVTTADVNFVKADSGDVRMAAGLSHVVVFAPNGKLLRVYALPNLNKLYETESPWDNYKSLAMGSRTNGPVLGVGGGGEVILMDVKDTDIKVVEGSTGKPGVHGNNLRAAPDGTAFTTFDGFGGNNKVKLLTEVNRKWKVTDLPQVPFPGIDRNLYGNGAVVARTGAPVVTDGVGVGSGTWYVPAITGSGGDFVKLAAATGAAKNKRGVALTVHSGGNADTPVPGSVTMIGPEVDRLMDVRGNPPDQHLFYVPEAKILIILTGTKDRLIVRKTNPNG